MSEQPTTALAERPATPRASNELAAMLGIEPRMMIDTIKAQCFVNTTPDRVSDTQLAAFISTAHTLGVNPLLPGFLYAYPSKSGGITPILGPDGVLKKLDEQITSGKLDGYECTVYPEDVTQKPTHATAQIFRKGSDHPAKYTALLSEWAVNSNPNWGSRTRHMLWLRAIKQAARQVIHGLPMDADEYKLSEAVNVTPEPIAETPAPRPEPPKRAKKGAAAVKENAPEVVVTEAEQASATQQAAPTVVTEAPKAVEPAPKAAPVPAPEARKEAPLAALKDGETVDVACEVEEFKCVMATVADGNGGTRSSPTVQARVTGGFNGNVLHFDGATQKGETLVENREWQLESPVRLKLFGYKTKKGNVLARVESISVEAGAGTDAVDAT